MEDRMSMIQRPEEIQGKTIAQKTGCGTAYITVNEHEGKVFEVFLSLGKAGG